MHVKKHGACETAQICRRTVRNGDAEWLFPIVATLRGWADPRRGALAAKGAGAAGGSNGAKAIAPLEQSVTG
jgi:hypothetical protein